MKVKYMGLALALAGMVSVQAQASEAAVEAATPATLALTAAPVNAVAHADLVALFGAEEAAKPMQLAALSDAEMRETEGAVIWFSPVAWAGARYALTGFTRHGLNQVISREGAGVSNRLSTLRNPTTAYSDIARKTTRYEGPHGVVVLNQNGKLVTAWGRLR